MIPRTVAAEFVYDRQVSLGIRLTRVVAFLSIRFYDESNGINSLRSRRYFILEREDISDLFFLRVEKKL